jgi:hypothetical protein
MITRITFLVHPYCYAKSLGNPTSMPEGKWRAYHGHEKIVARRWYEAVDCMDDADVVVYHPCYGSVEEKALADYGRRQLGDRFLTVRGRETGHPQGITAQVMAALAPQIREAFAVRGNSSWCAHDLRVAIFSHNYAQDILQVLADRGLSFDADDVTLAAFGESFEGCVTTWSTMVPAYLGVSARVEIAYEMTVPDTAFLLQCEYIERVSLPHDTALHLFLDRQQRAVVHYKRERVELAELSYYARLGSDCGYLAVSNMQGDVLLPPGGVLTSTVPPSLVRSLPGGTDVMVATGRGRGGEGPPHYPREAALFVRAEEVAPDAFFEMARKATILPESEK